MSDKGSISQKESLSYKISPTNRSAVWYELWYRKRKCLIRFDTPVSNVSNMYHFDTFDRFDTQYQKSSKRYQTCINVSNGVVILPVPRVFDTG